VSSLRTHQINAIAEPKFRARQQCAFGLKAVQQKSYGALTPRHRP
jgi:hypothetical protein